MPSPVGHTLAGLSICYAIYPRGKPPLRLIAIAVIAANLPDLDFLAGMVIPGSDYDAFHRGLSHSFTFAFAISLLFWASYRFAAPVRFAFATTIWTIGVFSHLFLDWLSADNGPPPGIPLLWPWSSQHFIADPTLFHSIERDDLFTGEIVIHNLVALSLEVLILCPLLFFCWRLNRGRKFPEKITVIR